MSYRLSKLAPGAYDVLLGDKIVASLVRGGFSSRKWTAELLDEVPPEQRPAPFTEVEHRFDSLEEAASWLGAEVEGIGVRVSHG